MQFELDDELHAKREILADLNTDFVLSKAINFKHREMLDKETSMTLNTKIGFHLSNDVNPDTSEFGIGDFSQDDHTPNFKVKCKGCDKMLDVYKQPANNKLFLNASYRQHCIKECKGYQELGKSIIALLILF